jgi:hypothetical protein
MFLFRDFGRYVFAVFASTPEQEECKGAEKDEERYRSPQGGFYCC